MKRCFSLITAVLLSAVLLFSCAEKMTEEEVRNIAEDLIEKSYVVNEIYFGEGLPHEETSESAIDPTEYDIKPAIYLKVISEDYSRVEDLKEAALEVYTKSFCDIIFKTAFNGVEDMNGAVFKYARYIDDFTGNLCIIADAEDSIKSRTYDISTLKIKGQKGDYVYFTVMSYVNGEEDGEMDLSLKKEEGIWRLDSPTF